MHDHFCRFFHRTETVGEGDLNEWKMYLIIEPNQSKPTILSPTRILFFYPNGGGAHVEVMGGGWIVIGRLIYFNYRAERQRTTPTVSGVGVRQPAPLPFAFHENMMTIEIGRVFT